MNFNFGKKLPLQGLIFAFGMSIGFTALAQDISNAKDEQLAYLIQSQNGDGSWGESEGEKVRATSAVLDALQHYSVGGAVYQRGVNWLANANGHSADSLARQIASLAKAGVQTQDLVSQLVNYAEQSAGASVWGGAKFHNYTSVDSALAIAALFESDQGIGISTTIDFLKNKRNTGAANSAEGAGWGFSDLTTTALNNSQVMSTAQMLLLFYEVGGSYWGQAGDKAAAEWLALQSKSTGAIADKDDQAIVETALAVQALAQAKELSGVSGQLSSSHTNGVSFLVNQMQANGSLGNDAFKTALALKALYASPQTLTDSDNDGIPDSVEVKLGTNPSVNDTDFADKGNGLYFNDNYGSQKFVEVVQGQTVTVYIDETPGTFSLNSGSAPNGMSFNVNNRSVYGTPSILGNYSFNYTIVKNDGAKLYGSAMIRVVSANSDTDGDGIPASYEITHSGVLSSLNANDANIDADGDGLTNAQEYSFGSNPALADADNDGLNDSGEQLAGTNPGNADSDSDGILDGDEVNNGLNPNANDASLDADADGLTNIDEINNIKTDPQLADTDKDGTNDGDEVAQGRNPLLNEPVLIVVINSMLLN